MSVSEILAALSQGKAVCYQSNRNIVRTNMFDELSIVYESGKVEVVCIDGQCRKKSTDFFIYGERQHNPKATQLDMFQEVVMQGCLF